MASTLLGLVGALVAGQLVWGPVFSGRRVDALVTKIVNDEARVLGASRGLAVGRDFAVRVLGRSQMAAEREALQRTMRSPEYVRAEDAMLGALGLSAPRGIRPPSSSSEVTGLYDSTSKRLLIGNWIGLTAGTFPRTRDIAQALLDRRFEVGRPQGDEDVRGEGSESRSDAAVALQALWEGDATVQALERTLPDGVLPPRRALAALTEELRATVVDESEGVSALELGRRLAIQLDGLVFVATARVLAPWSTIDQMWAHPPTSTEQILHPDKYQRGDLPDDVGARLPRRLASAWQSVHADTLGEVGARAFLRRAVGEYRAERAAAGWGGDRALLFREMSPNDTQAPAEFVAWITTWDGKTDAEDFAEQAGLALSEVAGVPLVAVASPRPARGSPQGPKRWRALDARGRLFAMEEQGGAVGMLLGAPADGDASLATLMSAAVRKAGRGRAGARKD